MFDREKGDKYSLKIQAHRVEFNRKKRDVSAHTGTVPSNEEYIFNKNNTSQISALFGRPQVQFQRDVRKLLTKR